jgi:hypothetical protein
MASEKMSIILAKMKRIFRILAIAVIIFLFIFIYFKYYFTYSDGYRSGYLQKFSHKGLIFKTYEGEMVLSSIKSSANVAIASEKFLFSVTDEAVAARLDTIQGEYVTVEYKQKRGTLFWRGESEYLVISVKLKK